MKIGLSLAAFWMATTVAGAEWTVTAFDRTGLRLSAGHQALLDLELQAQGSRGSEGVPTRLAQVKDGVCIDEEDIGVGPGSGMNVEWQVEGFAAHAGRREDCPANDRRPATVSGW